MDYPGRLDVSTRVFKERGRRIRVREGVVIKESEIKEMYHESRNVPSI